MTGTFLISSILFLLASFLSQTKAETQWSTESDAEEEEERKQNIMFLNESIGSTLALEEGTSTTPTPIDKLIAIHGNALWNREQNISDYDELHEESKHDASPENSVDRDSLENVNHFLQENPVTEFSIPLEGLDGLPSVESSNYMEIKEPSSLIEPSIHLTVNQVPSLTPSKMFLLSNDTMTSNIGAANVDAATSLTSFNCAFGDQNCKSPLLANTEELESKLKEKIASASSQFSSLPLWNIGKSLMPENSFNSESSDVFRTVTNTLENFTLLISPSESSIIGTSENIILIDETEADKGESVIHTQANKNEKSKPVKHNDDLEELSNEQTFQKVVTTSVIPPTKETIVPEIRHFTSTSLFTGLSEISSTPLTDSFPAVLSIASEESSKISSFYPPISYNEDKRVESPSVDYGKTSRERSNAQSDLLPTLSSDSSKSVIPTETPSKVLTETIQELVPLLSPSFQDSRTSIEVESSNPISSSFLEPSEIISQVLSTDLSTPLLETQLYSPSVVKDDTTSVISPDEALPPPRLTNPTCSSLPVCVEITLLDTTWEKFCAQAYEFREFLSKSVSHYTRPIFPHHIVFDTEICSKTSSIRPLQSSPDVTIAFYVTNDSGEYEERLTEICGVILRKWAPTAFRSSVIEVRLYSNEIQSTPLPLIPELNSGFVAAVSISAVAGVALCLLCILLVIMKQKLLQGRNSATATPSADAYSLDSLSINASFRRRRNRRSARSYLNHAFTDQEIPSHPLNEKTLTNCLKSRDLLEDEFKKIPMNMPKLDSIPEGAHVKNRYSNILPRPETRVVLAEPSGDPLKCYINANFIKGYEGKSAFYIACQAPLPEGIEDFWRMVWEQQCRVIIMLTMFEENGISRCVMYFPQSPLVSQQPYGDFQVSLLKKDVYEFYTISTLRLLDLEKNLFRDIVHLWFTGWPDVGVPKDPSSLITFVQQCRTFINCNSGPTVVHCSTGTGRTGVYLALDICMREFDESRSVDILQCVSQLRRDRGGAVQNKDQYILIYEAMLEYISRVANGSHCPSICSKTP
ncbi:tyrosine-protein phosphatase non-receptor type 7 [Trichonephila clavata]|uniref:protein-tyrosine-phosphatase n=1 Tax=Trichonephila clavata TaxID=2740835 RepID=A0A8X6G998_TRICU|nr:tyrosine-protein phosphatase non-receptor type 7 [Trichonephila clavata]